MAELLTNSPGWPRPYVDWVDRDETRRLPLPWIAGDPTLISPAEPDNVNVQRKARRDLCQVCGLKHDETSAPIDAHDPEWDGSVLHARCRKLTLAFCPHFNGATALSPDRQAGGDV